MAEEERILEVTPDFDGKRIDQCLAASFSDCSRSFLQKLLKDGKVSINGKTQKASSKVAAGDAVLVLLPEPEELNVEPENIPLDILYEDDDLLVVNKPKGMVVHPAAGHSSGTLVNAVLYHCRGNLSGFTGVLRPGIVHRTIWTQRVPWLSVRAISPTRASQNSSLYIPLPESTGQLSMGI